MKKLYIRFFKNRGNEIPHDSNVVCNGDIGSVDAQKKIAEYSESVVVWMLLYPEGKVDFVWL